MIGTAAENDSYTV